MFAKWVFGTIIVAHMSSIFISGAAFEASSDPITTENYQYYGCTRSGASECGPLVPSPLKDVSAGQPLVSLADVRDPDGYAEIVNVDDLSPDTFFHDYVLKHRPVVIRGAGRHWPARTKWTDEYLGGVFQDYSMKMETKDDDKWNLPRNLVMNNFLETYPTTKGLYLVDELHPRLHQDVTVPPFIQCSNITDNFFVSYLWMSGGDTASRTHVDTDENWLTVVAGAKRIVLISPVFSLDLHTDTDRLQGVLDTNLHGFSLTDRPRMRHVRYIVADVSEGDSVFIPQFWWHQVNSSSGRQLSVAQWWKSRPHGRVPGVRQQNYLKGLSSRMAYAGALANYERSVLVDVPAHRGVCVEDPKESLLTDYEIATDREEYLNDGQRDAWNDTTTFTMKEHRDHVRNDEAWCSFNVSDARAPCYHIACREVEYGYSVASSADGAEVISYVDIEDVMKDRDVRCLHYIMEYCDAPETHDVQCWIEVLMGLTKFAQADLAALDAMPSELAAFDPAATPPAWAAAVELKMKMKMQQHLEETEERVKSLWQMRHGADL